MSIQLLSEQLEKAREELRGLGLIAEERKLDETETAKVAELRESITELNGRIDLAKEAAAQPAARSEFKLPTQPAAPSVGETRSPYGKDSKASWFADQFAVRSGQDITGEARERLVADAASRNDAVTAGVAQRAYSAGTNSEGGYLVAPAYLQDAFVDLLAAGRVTADLCNKVPLPDKTASVNIPTQSGATAVAVHTENNALTETSATFSTVNAVVKRVGGAGTLPNFLLDRSMPGVDQIVLRDLAKQLAVKIDDIVLDQNDTGMKGILRESGTGAATATAGTATIAEYWPAFLNAYSDVSSGVYDIPTAIIMHPRRWAFLASLRDSATRPLISSLDPQNAVAAFNGIQVPGSGVGPRPTGSMLGIPVYLDARVPTNKGAGTDEDVVIFGRFDEAWLMEATPKFAVSADAEFLKDQTIVRVTNDVAFTAARRPAAFSIVSGTALNDTL